MWFGAVVLEVLGWCALALSMIYRFPQMYQMWQTEQADDLSPYMFLTQSVSYICYILYGLGVGDLIYIVSSSLSLLQNLIMLCFQAYLRRKQLKREAQCSEEQCSSDLEMGSPTFIAKSVETYNRSPVPV